MFEYNYSLTQQNVLYCLEKIKNIEGDIMEIGVACGNTSIKILHIAKQQNKLCYFIDSFKGMGEPHKFDLKEDGTSDYPKGKFNVNGKQYLINKLNNFKNNKDYFIYEGWIPNIFEQIPPNIIFSFIYVDVDHYLPTKESLEWCWKRINKNGMLLCDDYFIGEQSINLKKYPIGATKAIMEFLENNKYLNIFSLKEKQNQIAFIKNEF